MSQILPLKLYDKNDNGDDMLLTQCFLRMRDDGDLPLTFLPGMNTLGQFLKLFDSGELVFACDEQGIYFMLWTTPHLPRVLTIGFWIRKDRRGKGDAAPLIRGVHENLFEGGIEALASFTKSEWIMQAAVANGYKHIATIPKLWGDDDGYLLLLTKENFRG